MSINRVAISGNLTRNAELRQTPAGSSVLAFGVAVNDRAKNSQTGQWEDRANFVDCVMFGQRAQAIAQYLNKGAKVFVEGKLRYSSWQDNQGNKRSKLEVIVDEIEFSAPRQQTAQQQYQQPPQYQQPQGSQGYYSQPVQQTAPAVYSEDIPF